MNTNQYSSKPEVPTTTYTHSWLHYIIAIVVFIMSFLSKLFGSFPRKKDDSKADEPDTYPQAVKQDKEVTVSPKSAFLRTAGEFKPSKSEVTGVETTKTPLEISVEKTQQTPFPYAITKAENVAAVLPSSTEGAFPKFQSDDSMRPQALPEPSIDESKNTLVIKNLPFKFTKPELDQLLITHQAKAKNVRMLRDGSGRFTGIAFIRCPSKEEAGRLILAMNGLDIGGRFIQVEFKKKKKKGLKKPEIAPSAMSAPPTPSLSGQPNLLGIHTSAVTPPPGFIATSSMPMVPPVPYGYPVGYAVNEARQRNSYLTASGSALRPPTPHQGSGMLRASTSGILTSSASSIDDDEYLGSAYSALAQHRRASTSSVEDEEYLPSRRLSASMDDANAILHHYQQQHLHYPSSRFSLSSSSGAINSKYLPNIRPTRQPVGPDGKTSGFSEEYRHGRLTHL